MQIVDRYWSAICWDCQHLLSFSAFEYFRWDIVGYRADGDPIWQRKRPMEELLYFFDTLMNMPGTMINEAVLDDPQTVEWMGSQKDSDDGPRRVRLFGHTEQISLLKTLIEVNTGKPLPRPKIKGLELRKQRNINKIRNTVDAALERARARKERKKRIEEKRRRRGAPKES